MSAAARGGLWAAIGVVLLSLNLRPTIVAVAPILDSINADLELTPFAAGLLLTLPVLCFGVLGPVSPLLGRAIGMERTLALVLVAIVVGSVVRIHPSHAGLFAGTVLIGAGIAVGNVMVPGLIKRDFPHRLGLMSGLFTMSITGGASLAAGLTVPIAEAGGLHWTWTLAVWGVFAVLALAVWIPQVVHPAIGRVDDRPRIRLLRDPVAWWVTAYMGLQSFYFYALGSWLPSLLIDWGHDALFAGWMLSVFNLASIVPALIVPVIVARLRQQAGFSAGLIALYVVSTLGLLWAQDLVELWILIGGVAQGAALGLSLTLIVLRSPDAEHATVLSGMAQGYGYLIAAGGPLLFGLLNDVTGGWTAPIVLLLALVVVQAIAGHFGGLPRFVASRAVTVREQERTSP